MWLLDKILVKQRDYIINQNDLLAARKPSVLFWLLADKLGYLLEDDVEKVLSLRGVKIRKRLNGIIKKIGPMFLANPQVLENRNTLLNLDSGEEDNGIVLPDKPVIWIANHAFKDDTLASVLAANRNAYIIFGSVPQFYNTFDGLTAWLNGVVMTNRKVKSSRKASIKKAIRAMELGADIFMFPEGVWNKSPNALLLAFWPGVYKLAKETGALVVPMVHYLSDLSKPGKTNVIHTVVDEPIDISVMSEEDALEYLREKMATWIYLMMEKYGQSTRAEAVNSYVTSYETWENLLRERVATVDRYDLEIELCADYRRKDIVRAEDAFGSIANIKKITPENALHIARASQIVEIEKLNDFQRRF